MGDKSEWWYVARITYRVEGRNRTPQPSHIRTRRSPVIRLLFSNLTLRRSQFPVSKEFGVGLRKPVGGELVIDI